MKKIEELVEKYFKIETIFLSKISLYIMTITEGVVMFHISFGSLLDERSLTNQSDNKGRQLSEDTCVCVSVYEAHIDKPSN